MYDINSSPKIATGSGTWLLLFFFFASDFGGIAWFLIVFANNLSNQLAPIPDITETDGAKTLTIIKRKLQ